MSARRSDEVWANIKFWWGQYVRAQPVCGRHETQQCSRIFANGVSGTSGRLDPLGHCTLTHTHTPCSHSSTDLCGFNVMFSTEHHLHITKSWRPVSHSRCLCCSQVVSGHFDFFFFLQAPKILWTQPQECITKRFLWKRVNNKVMAVIKFVYKVQWVRVSSVDNSTAPTWAWINYSLVLDVFNLRGVVYPPKPNVEGLIDKNQYKAPAHMMLQWMGAIAVCRSVEDKTGNWPRVWPPGVSGS